MDIFGFDNDKVPDNETPKNNDILPGNDNKIPENKNNNSLDTQILIELSIRKHKRNLIGLMIAFAVIVIIINLLVVPYYFNTLLDEKISELELDARRERNLPDNYSMVGVEVGYVTMASVLEINCESVSESSAGSGFIINDDGYVITNAHVITYEKRNGFFSPTTVVYSSIVCYFYNNDTGYNLDVINYDLTSDLAILKFSNPPASFSPVVFGNSSLISLGEEVVAIGNAEGLGLALTVGVISDPLKEFDDGTAAIQTDAAINPGNSGGPLFNIYAEFIGVTTFKIIDTEANEGMGFAIPSIEVINFIEATENSEHITIDYSLSAEY